MNFSQLLSSGLIIAVIGTGNGFIISQNRTDEKSKIEGGEYICIDKAPYQVYLKENNNFICGGALIRPNVVLTAAHCVEDFKNGNIQLTVVAGTDRTTTKKRIKSAEIVPETVIVHPKYDTKSVELEMKYDVAIIMLQSSFPMTNAISTIEPPTSSVKIGEELLLTGIGAVDGDSFCASPYLKAYKPEVVRCKNYLSDFEPPITSFQGLICHKSLDGYRSRMGDSGGPLVNARGELAGIHQGSASDCQIAVNVFYLLDWIEDILGLYVNEIF